MFCQGNNLLELAFGVRALARSPLEGSPADWIATRMLTLADAASGGSVMGQITPGYSDA